MRALKVASEVNELGITAVGHVLDDLRPADEDDVARVLRSAEAAVTQGLNEASIANDPQLAEYRAAHERVGAGNRHLAAPEVLRTMLLQRGRLPRISPVVDLYNAVSLRTRLAIGVHDAAAIAGRVELRRVTGSEQFVPLGASEPKRVRPGEYAYVDGVNDVLCRLEVQQAEKTKITPGTTRCLVIVQANAAFPPNALPHGAEQLIDLLQRHCGAKVVV